MPGPGPTPVTTTTLPYFAPSGAPVELYGLTANMPSATSIPDGSTYTQQDGTLTTYQAEAGTWVPQGVGTKQMPQGVRGQISNMVVYGHSIAAGGSAVDSDHRYSAVLAGLLGSPDDGNYAVGGAYLGRDGADGQNAGISYIAQREVRNVTRAPYVAARDLAVLNFGYEDIMLGQSNTAPTGSNTPPLQAQTIFKNSLRTALSLVRSASRKYAGDKTTNLDASIVLGTASNWTIMPNPVQGFGHHIPPTFGGSVGFLSTTTSGAGGAVTITIPGDYPGSAVCPLAVVMVADPNLSAGTITASGAATGTFDLVQQVAGGTPANTSGTCDAVNQRRSLVTWRFTGNAIAASNGAAQTLTLTPSGLTTVASGNTFTGNTLNGFPTLASVSNYTICRPGALVTGTGFQANTYIVSVNPALSQATLSSNANATNSGTTVTVPGSWGIAEWLIEAQDPPLVEVPQLDNFGNPGILVFQTTRNSDITAFNSVITSLVTSEFNDGSVLTPSYSLGQSGNTYGQGGTAGNTAAATIDSATGFGGTTGTNCKINTVTAWPASGAAMLAGGYEIVTWTGVTNSGGVATLSGVARGAWNTTPTAQSASALVDTLNVAALPNIAPDGTHLSSRGHALIAQSLATALQPSTLDSVARPKTAVRRARLTGIYRNTWNEQIIAPQGTSIGAVKTLLGWDQAQVDTGGMQNTLANILGGLLNGGGYNNISINADGLYAITFHGTWSIGKAINTSLSSAQAGLVSVELERNGITVGGDTRGSYATTDLPNGFFLIYQAARFCEIELRSGDQITVNSWQSGSGALTTVTDNPLTSVATTINLAATAGMAANDILRIDNESIIIGTVTSGTQLTGCSRGSRGTTAASHTSGVNAYTGRALFGAGSAVAPTKLVVQRVGLL